MSADKELLEIEKISLEIKNLRKRYFQHPTFWLSVVSAIVAVGGVFFQSQTSELKNQVAELKRERAEKQYNDINEKHIAAESLVKELDLQMAELLEKKRNVELQLADIIAQVDQSATKTLPRKVREAANVARNSLYLIVIYAYDVKSDVLKQVNDALIREKFSVREQTA